MKKTYFKIKKALSLLVATTILGTALPTNIFANYQSPVTVLTIQNDGVSSGGNYNVRLNWTRPLYNAKSDGAIINGDELDRSYSYTIEWRNATTRQTYGSVYEPVAKTNEEGLTKGLSKNLESGSIYSFRVTPSHTNTYQKTVDGVIQPAYDAAAPLDTTIVPAEALYMTDIKLTSVSEGGGFKVTWQNPTYLGTNVFTGYRLYYEAGGAAATFSAGSDFVDVSLTDSGIVSNGNGTLTYTFDVPNVEIGKLYALKIEPLYGTDPIKTNGISKVNVGGVPYSIAFSNNEYRIDDAYVRAGLYIVEEGLEDIRLYWDSLASIRSVSKVEIWSYPNGNLNNPIQLGVISGSDASNINYWLTETPDRITGYKIIITHADGTMESSIVYYDPSHKDFEPYKPIIQKAVASDAPDIDLYWQAFLRNPYNSEEENAINNLYNKYVDEDLIYKIWVTDDLNNLSDLNFQPYYVINQDAVSFNKSNFDLGYGESTLVYNTLLTTYYTYVNNEPTLKKIVDNKIYYIKIQATRNPGDDVSEEEFYSVFVPPNNEVITNPVTMGNPPLRILKDSNKLDVVTENTIGIEWDKHWYEVYDSKTQTWNAVIGVNESGKIVYGKDALNLEDSSKIFNLYELSHDSSIDTIKNQIYNNLINAGAVNSAGEAYTSIGDLASDLPVRAMDISSASYEVFTVPLNHVEANGGYETYLSTIEKLNGQWINIPGTSDDPQSYIVKSQQAPTSGPLTSNTAYVIYFRSYVLDSNGNKVYSYYPSYVLANTLKPTGPIIVTPPTQQIEISTPITDTSIMVRWPYSSSFTYDLKYTSKVTDYPNGGVTIGHNEIIANSTIMMGDDGVQYIYYNVKKLFPNTNYYFWLKATSGNIASGWSPAVNDKTKDLETPPVPAGLGLIGLNNLEIINAANDTNFEQTDTNYLIVEWLRINADDSIPPNSIVKLNGGEFLTHSSILSTYATKFNNLQGNKKYYVRVKSRISISKTDNIKRYSYIISLADNSQFLDAIEFEVPTYGYVDNGFDVLVRESNWSTYKSFTSGQDREEFDGDFDPELYPLPENNYDVKYDESSDTLTYEFRGDDEDSNGVPNHGVDNRFISELIKDNLYDFAVDVTLVDGEKVKNRKVVIPYSIVNAMGDNKTSLTIKTDNMYTKIDLSMFKEVAKANNISDFGKGGKVTIDFNEVIGSDSLITYGEKYISTPQKLSVNLTTNTRNVEVKSFPKAVEVALAIDNRYIAVDHNVKPYYRDGNTENWIAINSNYSTTNNKFTFDTMKAATFTAIGKEAPRNTEVSSTNASSQVVSTYIKFTDLPYYTASDKITANQFNNIVSAVAKGEYTVAINKALSSDDFTQLGRGKLLVSGSYVNREKGIASLVRLYELKTKSSLGVGEDISLSGFSDYAAVSKEYKAAVEKAIDLGMLDLADTINPSGDMTFGEFMYMLEFIVTS